MRAAARIVDIEVSILEKMMKVPSQKRIYRDLDSGIISGVCAGVARYFDIDAVWVRAAAVAGLFIATPITLVAYIAAVILLPRLV